MQIIVDGYNIIKSWNLFKKREYFLDLEEKRNKLINILVEFQSLSNAKIIIIFDGKLTSEKREYFLDLEVVYSSKKDAADTVIERMIRERDKSTEVWVVTSDKDLRLRTFNNGALNMHAKELEKKVSSVFRENNLKSLNEF